MNHKFAAFINSVIKEQQALSVVKDKVNAVDRIAYHNKVAIYQAHNAQHELIQLFFNADFDGQINNRAIPEVLIPFHKFNAEYTVKGSNQIKVRYTVSNFDGNNLIEIIITLYSDFLKGYVIDVSIKPNQDLTYDIAYDAEKIKKYFMG